MADIIVSRVSVLLILQRTGTVTARKLRMRVSVFW